MSVDRDDENVDPEGDAEGTPESVEEATGGSSMTAEGADPGSAVGADPDDAASHEAPADEPINEGAEARDSKGFGPGDRAASDDDSDSEIAAGAEGDPDTEVSDEEIDDEGIASAAVAPGSRPRRSPRVHWGRGIAGAALSVVAAAAVVGATMVELPALGSDPASITVVPEASPAVVSCTGPLLAVGRDSSAADEITVAQRGSVTVGTSDNSDPESSRLDAVGVTGKATSPRYELAAEGSAPASLSVATSADIRDDDIAGFSASACRPAAMESWIVGGSTAVGNSDILLLANPGRVNATASLTVFGTDGPVPVPGDAIAIPAGSQIALPLAGIAGGEESPAVRVTAEGAPLRAALQSSQVRTLDPVGVDVQEAVTPGDRQVFPGIVVTEDAVDADATPAIVRLLSRAGGAVAVAITPAGQTSPVKTLDLDVDADTPVSASLDGLDPGRYTVAIEGEDGPVVSAVWQTTGPKGEEDFAWQTPSPAVAAPVTVAVPDGPLAQAYFVNDGDEPVTVAITGASDDEITLSPGETGHLRLASGRSYALAPQGEGGASVHAVVAFHDGGSLATLPMWPDPAASSDVTVYP